MQVNLNPSINQSRPNFKALKKISCFQGDLFSKCHLNEERIVDELKKIVNNDNFFIINMIKYVKKLVFWTFSKIYAIIT